VSGYSIDDLKAKIKFYLDTTPQPAVDADAKREAESLAMSLWSKWYKDESPNFELCDSVAGVITQINNMTTGLVREDVSWGVDWGRSGDRSCVSICKSFPDGSLEIVATEFSPHTTLQAVVTDELTGKQWSAMRTVIQEHAEKFRSADTYEMASAYMDAAPEAVYQALLSAGKEAVAAPQPVVPEGYVLVPTVPTEKMIDAGVYVAMAASVHGKGGWNNYIKALYKALLSAGKETV